MRTTLVSGVLLLMAFGTARGADAALTNPESAVIGNSVGGAGAVVSKRELWASPGELRKKKMIGTGLYSTRNVPWNNKLDARFLLENPGFVALHPFDGVTLKVPIDGEWLSSKGMGGTGNFSDLDVLAWSKVEVPYSAVKNAVSDLRRISWGHLTDNFLWCSLVRAHRHAPDVDYAVDLNDNDQWAVVEKNAALMARVCREAGFKGFMLDTEEYDRYASGEAYPLGKDSQERLRQRGRQWIKAVQSEYPGITIVIFFAWSPDLDAAEFLAGVRPFLDGVLESIKEPARLVHCYENTFYYGQIAGSRYTAEGFPGGRERYKEARRNIIEWRSLSSDPDKYDKFVHPGMAAWVESDPYDLQDPSATGGKDTIWSNLPLALAYSDDYVWVWSERTNYGESYKRGGEPNPFLLSIGNQTFNTGREAVSELSEDFRLNPLLGGWYFDFDMLDVGRRKDPSHVVPVFSPEAVAYGWSRNDRCVLVQSSWMTGPNGDEVGAFVGQRRRYVHPIKPLTGLSAFRAEFEFRVESFGSDPANPIVLGLFGSGDLLDRNTVSLRIKGQQAVELWAAGRARESAVRLDLPAILKTGRTYILELAYDTASRMLKVTLSDKLYRSEMKLPAVSARLPEFLVDEIGAALWDVDRTSTPPEKAHRYRLERVSLCRQ